jgi:hypothetical protein
MIKISQNIEKFKKLGSVFYTILNISLGCGRFFSQAKGLAATKRQIFKLYKKV